MRVSYLVRWVNLWFARVVYERDEWDRALAELSESGGGFGALVGGLARLAIWFTRRVLWVLMYAGHAASGFLSRQMEYDADRYQVRMVGTAVFPRLMWRLRELSLAQNGAYADVFTSWRQRRLPDNLPKLVLANVPQIPKDVLAAYRKESGSRTTGVVDTHPADRDRIAHAKAEAADGIFHLDGPATDVFRNFDSLARLVTFEFYRNAFGPQVSKEQLYPVAELVQTQAVEREGFESLVRFFLHAFHPRVPLPLPGDYPAAPADPPAAKAALVKARAAMEATRDEALAALKRRTEKVELAANSEYALTLLKVGVKIKPADFGLTAAKPRAAEDKLREAEAAVADQLAALDPFLKAAARRLTTALGVLGSDAFLAHLPDGPTLRDEARALYPCAAHLGGRAAPEATPLIRAFLVLNSLVGFYQMTNGEKNEPLKNAILRAAGVLRDRLEDQRWKIGDLIDYPFEHAQEQLGLSRFILPDVPAKDDVGGLLQTAAEAGQRLDITYARALGRLTFAAEEVERALGLPPIECEPPPEEGEQEQDASA
jgi:hypothetical protein